MGASHDHDHSHDPAHTHDHHHPHDHGPAANDMGPAADAAIPDSELAPADLARRRLLQSAGLTGAGAVTASLAGVGGVATAAAAERSRKDSERAPTVWLTGDHHIHTQYSPDGLYRVEDQVKHAAAYGLDWVVITEHAYMVAGEAARAGTGQVSADSAMGGDTIAVDPAAAADAASAYLAASDVTGTVTITGGGTILEVVTSDTYDPRFLGALGVGPLTVGGHAQARLVRVMDGSEQ